MIAVRRAVSALILGIWALPCILLAFLPDTGVQAFFASLAAIYVASIVGVVARWFWARWFAVGVAWWATFTGGSLMLFTGVGTFLVVFTLSHFAVVGLLSGGAMRAEYEGRPGWRERWNLDERAAGRIGSLISNLGTLLPFAAFYAFFPRDAALGAAVAALLAAAGTVAVVRMRTWGLVAIATSGVLLIAVPSMLGAQIVGALLILATARFAPDVVRWFRR